MSDRKKIRTRLRWWTDSKFCPYWFPDGWWHSAICWFTSCVPGPLNHPHHTPEQDHCVWCMKSMPNQSTEEGLTP